MDATPASGAFEDALFMLAVRPVDDASENDTLPLFQSVMPRSSVFASDKRGGLASRAPAKGVQLLTKKRVSIALFSRDGTLSADDLVDAFVQIRDAHRNNPRERANALRAWLKEMHDQKHVFSLALFDDSGRAFAAWTPRSAPLSFGHAGDGSAVVVAAQPQKRTLVGRDVVESQALTLAHLPAGRFVYGHGYLKPFEFTDMWASALTNRAGVAAARVFGSTRSPSAARASPDAPPADDHAPLSMEEKKKWRWESTGSRAEQAKTWISSRKPVSETTVSASKTVSAPSTPPRTKTSKTSQSLSPAAPAFVAAKKAKIVSSADQEADVLALASDLATAAARRLDFAVGAAAHFAFRTGLARVNRYDSRADKRFMTLLLLRVALTPEIVRRSAAAAMKARSEARQAALGEHFQALSVLETDVSEDVSRELAMADASAADAGRALGSTLVAATKKTLRAATKRSAAKEDERRKAIPARVRGVAGNSNSSVVVCDLKTGVCCVGDQCFIG
jgi:hypothetical protein